MQPLLCYVLVASLAGAAAQETQEKLFVNVWPERPVVAFGSSIVVNCSTNCKDVVSGGLETNLGKEEAGEGPGWKAFRLVNVSHWDPVPSCFFECRSGDIFPHRVNFTVYRAPERVVLDPVPVMEVGEEYVLTCRVSSVAPIRNLSVSFHSGRKELGVTTFEKHAAREADDVVVSHTFTAEQANHGEEVSCRATLDLRPEGPRFEKASLNQSVKTVESSFSAVENIFSYKAAGAVALTFLVAVHRVAKQPVLGQEVFPGSPELSSPQFMELHTSETVTCKVRGVFPVEEAQFSLTFAEKNLSLQANFSGNTAWAQAQVSPTVAGNHSLRCTVSLGPVTRRTEMNVNVYSLPDLVLTIDPRETLADENVTIMCFDSHPEDTQPKTFVTRIRNSQGVLGSGHSLPLEVAKTVGEEDNGQEFTCELVLEFDGIQIRKTKSANLTVYYGPRMNDSSCPGTLIWKAGIEETLGCTAWGNPPPQVECRKDGVLYRPDEPLHVTSDHQGSYHCRASNEHGSVANTVTVRVETDEPPTLLICLVILGVVVVASAVGVGYYMYYTSHKIKKYRLRRKAAGKPTEKKSLNGSVQMDNV